MIKERDEGYLYKGIYSLTLAMVCRLFSVEKKDKNCWKKDKVFLVPPKTYFWYTADIRDWYWSYCRHLLLTNRKYQVLTLNLDPLSTMGRCWLNEQIPWNKKVPIMNDQWALEWRPERGYYSISQGRWVWHKARLICDSMSIYGVQDENCEFFWISQFILTIAFCSRVVMPGRTGVLELNCEIITLWLNIIP